MIYGLKPSQRLSSPDAQSAGRETLKARCAKPGQSNFARIQRAGIETEKKT